MKMEHSRDSDLEAHQYEYTYNIELYAMLKMVKMINFMCVVSQ
jgi:hypothetical protein